MFSNLHAFFRFNGEIIRHTSFLDHSWSIYAYSFLYKKKKSFAGRIKPIEILLYLI